MPKPKSRLQLIAHELRAHLPFSLLGVLGSMLLLYVLQRYGIGPEGSGHAEDEALHGTWFHATHFAHIFLSAVTSAAIFFRHERNALKALSVGTASSILFCGLSDVLLPYIGGFVLQSQMEFHWDLIEQPITVIGIALAGSLLGLLAEVKFRKISYWTHSSHVFVSSLASLLYLVVFGLTNWTEAMFGVFLVTTVAVVIPCCSSDILFPLSWMSGLHGHEHEDEHTSHH